MLTATSLNFNIKVAITKDGASTDNINSETKTTPGIWYVELVIGHKFSKVENCKSFGPISSLNL